MLVHVQNAVCQIWAENFYCKFAISYAEYIFFQIVISLSTLEVEMLANELLQKARSKIKCYKTVTRGGK